MSNSGSNDSVEGIVKQMVEWFEEQDRKKAKVSKDYSPINNQNLPDEEDYETKINKKINVAYKLLQEQFENFPLPSNARLEIAISMSSQIEGNRLSSPSQIEITSVVSEKTIQKIFSTVDKPVEEIRKSLAKRANQGSFEYEEVQPQNALAIINLNNIEDIYENDGNSCPIIKDSSDARFAFKDKDDENQEKIIQWTKEKISKIIEDAEKNPEKQADFMQKIENLIGQVEGGLGIDALIELMDNKANSYIYRNGTYSYNGVEKILSSSVKKAVLVKTIEFLDASKTSVTGLVVDQHTMRKMLSLYTAILSEKGDDPYLREIKEKMKYANPDLYEFTSENLVALQYIKDVDIRETEKTIFGDYINNAEKRSAKDFLQTIEEDINLRRLNDKHLDEEITAMSMQSGSLQVERLNVTSEVFKRPPISEEQKIRNLTNTMTALQKQKGDEQLMSMIQANIERTDGTGNKNYYATVGVELLMQVRENPTFATQKAARKKLFMSMMQNEIGEDALTNMVTLDRDTSKEILQEMIESQNEQGGTLRWLNQ